MDAFDAKLHRSIADLNPSLWQSCFGDSDPFLRWDFLRGLETSACTTAESGWQPAHITLEQRGAPAGVLPASSSAGAWAAADFEPRLLWLLELL